jgi:hypothetical protein
MPDQVFLTFALPYQRSHSRADHLSGIPGARRAGRNIDDFCQRSARSWDWYGWRYRWRRSQAFDADRKAFEGGREALAHLDVPIESLTCIQSMEGDQITFEDQP